MQTVFLNRPKNLWNMIVGSLLVLIVLFPQIQHGQLPAVIAACLLFYLSILRFLARGRILMSSTHLVCCGLWLAMIAYLVRPEYVASMETKIEVFWLIIGLIMLLTASINSGYTIVSASLIYETALLGAVLVIVSMITKSTLGGLLSAPYATTRYVGGFDGPNEMGHFYVLALSLMLGEHIFRRNVRFLWVKIGIFVIVIISSWSRSAFGALLLMYMLCFFWAYVQAEASKRSRIVVLFLFLSIIMVCVYFQVVQPLFDVIRSRAVGRHSLLETTSAIVRQRPICGHGLGSYLFVGDGKNATPHSEYLLFIASGGILGLVLLVGFYLYWLRIALKKQMYPEALTLLVFYALEAFFNNLVRGRVSFFFWALILLVFTGSQSECFDARECSAACLKQPG
jgi:hypothetical protein